MRIGVTRDHRGIYTVRFIEKGQTYDITDLKEEDLRQTLEAINTLLRTPHQRRVNACPWENAI